jgi:preprotein translocase subunit SecE
LSSQEQASSYKRRSSGKRNRRPSQARTDGTGAADSTQGVEAGINTAVAEKPVTTKASTAKTSAAPAPRVRMAGKSTATAPSSPWQRVINTNRFEGLQKFIRETMAEIRKVIWPDRETTRNLTLVVIAVSIVLGILLGGIDYVLFQLFEALP